MVRIEVEKRPTSTTAFWSWALLFLLLAMVIWAVIELV
ncbi:hypothetical protein DFR33_108132 [Bradymonas sediminis]|nr:hypothetical protein DFR33_108132 [Bradymonas sediminis]